MCVYRYDSIDISTCLSLSIHFSYVTNLLQSPLFRIDHPVAPSPWPEFIASESVLRCGASYGSP